MKRRSRKRARSTALDVAVLEPTLAARSAMGKAAVEIGLKLVSARAYACADGSYTLRAVWRGKVGSVVTSMAETMRGLRIER